MEPPFIVSRRAEKFLRGFVDVPGQEMGLVLAYGFEDKEADGRIADRYDGVHFYVGWNEPGKWSGERVSIAGLDLWISGDVAEALRGKTLTVIQRHEGEKEIGVRELLVAV